MRMAVAAFVATAVVVAGSCGGEGVDRSGHPDNPPIKDKRTVEITAYSSFQPYVVYVEVRAGDGQSEHFDSGPVSGVEKYAQTLEYDSGAHVNIYVRITPPRAGSEGYCQIKDGANNVNRNEIGNKWRVTCELTTKR